MALQKIAATALVISLLYGTAIAADRSRSARAEFARINPCPVNGNTRGACPSYHVDHITPLCAGGADHHSNMQWLTIEEHRDKTKSDVYYCAAVRKINNKNN